MRIATWLLGGALAAGLAAPLPAARDYKEKTKVQPTDDGYKEKTKVKVDH